MAVTTTTTFTSHGTRCSAWLTRPPGQGPHPAVVLAHGLGANHTMALSRYERHFAAAGLATLAFDYRNLGASEGTPRQHLSPHRHRQDITAAIKYVREMPDIDASRVALWGTSLGAMHVLRVAADRPDLAAVVVQCPIVHGPATLRRARLASTLRIEPAIVHDAVQGVLGRERRYVPIVGAPGSLAVVTTPGAEDGWQSTVDPDGKFDNRIAASNVVEIGIASAKRAAQRISAPLLVCVSSRETLMDPRHAEDVARRAPRGIARRAPRGIARHYAALRGTTMATISRSTTRRCWPIYSPTRPPSCRSISVPNTPNLLHANDIRLADFAGTLSDAEWSRPSLCTEWTNHEVLAHLVLGYRVSLRGLAARTIRHRGSFDRANAALAAESAQHRSPAELIDEFLLLMDHPRGIGRIFPRPLLLGDHVIHELDIAFALGKQPTVATEALLAVLNTQVRVPNPFVPAAARARGLRLHATDTDWNHGKGSLAVTGTAAQLASVLAGRPWALDQLSGDGVTELMARISTL